MRSKEEPRLARRVTRMGESETLRMAQRARDLAANGIKVINLSLGEPDFDTPQHIKDAAIQALADGFTKYTPVPGLPLLRDAISRKFKRDNDLDYSPGQIVVSNGAKQSLANVMLALLEEGDEVLVFSPYWVSYYEMIRLTDATPVMLSAGIEQDFKVLPEQLASALTPRTRMVLFSSPCNPTGAVYSQSELEAIAAVLADRPDIIVVSDEIYEYINFTGQHYSIGRIEGMRDRTVTVNGFAKGFAMTGWRLGYLGAPKWIADACSKIQSQFTSGANAFGQVAAAHALNSDLSPTLAMRDQFLTRRDLLRKALLSLPGWQVNQPQGAFYLFPDISDFFGKSGPRGLIRNSEDFSDFLLDEAHVALVGGAAFGSDSCIRISYAASSESLLEAADRIRLAMEKLH
jgi:aspartate aminotransferase